MKTGNPTVRIVVSEPFDWDYGNLFGSIEKEQNGNIMLVRLTKKIRGHAFSSNLIELTPRYKDETFKPLTQLYSVTVNGALISLDYEKDFIIVGNVTYD